MRIKIIKNKNSSKINKVFNNNSSNRFNR